MAKSAKSKNKDKSVYESDLNNKKDDKKIGQTFVFIVISVLLVLTFLFTSYNKNKRNHVLSKQESTMGNLKTKIDLSRRQNENLLIEADSKQSGIDRLRLERDYKIIDKFLYNVFDWNNYDEYADNRQTIINKYKIDPNGGFLQVFMPDIKKTEIDGKNYNDIDLNGLNMSFDRNNTYVESINGSNYRYLSFIIVNSTSSVDSSVSSSMFAVLECTIDLNGNISDVSASSVYK